MLPLSPQLGGGGYPAIGQFGLAVAAVAVLAAVAAVAARPSRHAAGPH